MKLIIRGAEAADIEMIALYNAALALETEHRTLDLERVRRGVAALIADEAKGRYFVAEADGQVVGQVMITYEWSDWRDGNFWWLQSVYVRESHRGQGVFRGLFAKVIETAKAAGNVCGVRLYVEEENHRAQKVYTNLGLQGAPYLVMEQDFVL